MAAATLVFGLDQFRSPAPLPRDGLDGRRVYGRMIYQRDEQGSGPSADLFDAAGDGAAHRAFGIGIEGEAQTGIVQLRSDVGGSMTNYHHNLFNSGSAQIGQAAFNDSLVTEGQQRFESAHAA